MDNRGVLGKTYLIPSVWYQSPPPLILTGKKCAVASHSDPGLRVSLHLSSKSWRKVEARPRDDMDQWEIHSIWGLSLENTTIFVLSKPRPPPERVELCNGIDGRSEPGTLLRWFWNNKTTQKRPNWISGPLRKNQVMCSNFDFILNCKNFT